MFPVVHHRLCKDLLILIFNILTVLTRDQDIREIYFRGSTVHVINKLPSWIDMSAQVFFHIVYEQLVIYNLRVKQVRGEYKIEEQVRLCFDSKNPAPFPPAPLH